MTHLSDLSYLERGVSSVWFSIWLLIYVYRWDRFDGLSPRRLMRFELRSVVTVLAIISMILKIIYDIGNTILKYNEGFWVNPVTKEIQAKPASNWDTPAKHLVEPLYYVLACTLASLNSMFFLLQAFWSYISKTVTKTSFVSSLEFKVNIVLSCLAVALYPTVQYLFRNDYVYRETVPQVIFSILTFFTGVLGIRTHFRLVALIRNARLITNEATFHVVQKLEYFKDMNIILTFGFFGTSVPLGIMSVDGMLPKPIIAHNKFASDFLITNMNFFEFIMRVTLIMIFYPRKSSLDSPPGSSSSKPHSSKDARMPRFNDVKPKEVEPYHRQDRDVIPYRREDNDIVPYRKQDDIELYNREEPKRSEDTNLWSYETPTPTSTQHLVNEHRHETVIPMTPPPAATNAPGSGFGTMTNDNRSRSKLEMLSSTIYYQDALSKAQHQDQEQANEAYARALEDGSISSSSSTTQYTLPQRTFSQNSSYSNSGHREHQRSASHSSIHPLVPKPSRHPARAANNSVDYSRPSRDYPSLVQETTYPSQQADVPRKFSTRDSRERRHYQQQQPTISEADYYNTSGRFSNDSDRDMIQVAYVRNVNQDDAAYNESKFYEDLGRAHSVSPTAATAPRPFSPLGPRLY